MINKKDEDGKFSQYNFFLKNSKGQEEMIGFGVIVVIVSIGLLILLSFLIRSPSKGTTENYQVESFIQSALQYTSECENQIEFLPVQNLIIACDNGEKCLDGSDSCEVLNSTITNLINSGWNVGNQSVVKGYNLKITSNGQDKLTIKEGNQTSNSKGGFQDFARSGNSYEISLNVYN
jgi:hypothetical protein